MTRLRGRSRAWVLVSTAESSGPVALIHAYLSRIGRQRGSIVLAGTPGHPIEAAALYEFDLSDPERLASASAETFPTGDGAAPIPDAQWWCYGVAVPDHDAQ